MMSYKFTRSEYDHCVYFQKLENGIFIILALHVDDILVARKSMVVINKLNSQLAGTFEMKDLGEEKQILGMEIQKDRRNGELWLSQENYMEKVLLRFSMNNVKLVQFHLVSNFKLSSGLCPSNDEEKEYISCVPYSNVVGCLMCAMVSTRPCISHAIRIVNRYMENLGQHHWEIVK